MSRPATMVALLGASLGVPYAVDRTSDEVARAWSRSSQAVSAETVNRPAPPHAVLQAPAPAPEQSLSQEPASRTVRVASSNFRLEEVLRMDLTREWIYQRWPRKSTGLSDPELFGIRVALVTGTQMSDLAGSLTYYFNRHNVIDRIGFRGRTGDPRHLVQLLTQHYGLQWQTSVVAGEELYQNRAGGKVESELRIRPESVVRASDPHQSFLVEFELNRPGSGRYVLPTAPALDLPELRALPVSGALPAVDRSTPLGQVQENAVQSAAIEKAEAEAAALRQQEAEQKSESPSVPKPRRAPWRWPN